ncbi:SPW repeat protein [Actinopolyspora mortivallis]|uniref:SPW repeat protein n=1 Tax=Actinopolyspora mortivallis TaxID=33906 RepID=UPI00047D4AA6|nr:SPW repeat protein [Actinopolyspora mortivallis]
MAQAGPIEKHPDLAEMRARYEEASETPQGQTLEGATLLAGVYLAMSPWVIQFSATSFDVAMGNLIVGVTVAVLALAFASAYSRTHTVSWVVPLLGAWTVIAPFVVLGSAVGFGMMLSNVITGAVIILLGLGMSALTLMRRE